MDCKLLQEFAVVAKMIWWRRNRFIFDGSFAHPNAIVKDARRTMEMLNEERSWQVSVQPCNSVETWQAPPTNWIKVNWDSAVDKIEGFIGVGVVARDNAGHTIASKRTKKHLFPDPALAEAYGALIAVQFGVELGLSQVIIEGDSLQVINSLKREEEGCNSASMFIEEAKHLLNSFAKWEVSHVRRNGNYIVHLLAKNALSIYDHVVTLEVLPTCIQVV
ncbi:hypothetical protein F2P56_030195 [Juglans regia]|uniref:RNase H type-1 domain-containing protein n=2 Tax=Juglans regia TaxID=51240 RepID=A0A833WHL1_JUGRE|nr:uncharacterized protein LOC109013579 [Juglans regia]KAF5449783.1 hypothetical protein F2P56_030195 [Juglans regia]